MKEKFRDKRISKLSVNLGSRIWRPDVNELVEYIQRITSDYLNMGYTLTLRQLYYQLVSQGLIPNNQKVYQRISTLVTDLRYNGELDWEAIEDRGRQTQEHIDFVDLADLVKTATNSYRLQRNYDQAYHIEIITEKDALSEVIGRVANKWHLPLTINKGYSSASTMYQLYCRIQVKYEVNDQRTVILYIGDHDPSGLDMVEDIEKRVREFLHPVGGEQFEEIRHVALTREQIDYFKPPPNPAKSTDPRFNKYISKHGYESWEVDSLPPNILADLIEHEILTLTDEEKYKEKIEWENEDKKKLKEFAENFREK